MGIESHWYAPRGVRKVVKSRLCSSILRDKYAYLRSIDLYSTFPCKFCNEAAISGTTDGGDCIIVVSGEKSITNLPNLTYFYVVRHMWSVDIPYRCMSVVSIGALLL